MWNQLNYFSSVCRKSSSYLRITITWERKLQFLSLLMQYNSKTWTTTMHQLLGLWNNSWHDGSLSIIWLYFIILIPCLELEVCEIDLIWELAVPMQRWKWSYSRFSQGEMLLITCDWLGSHIQGHFVLITEYLHQQCQTQALKNEFRTQKIHKMNLSHKTKKKNPHWKIFFALTFFGALRWKAPCVFKPFTTNVASNLYSALLLGLWWDHPGGPSGAVEFVRNDWSGLPSKGMSPINPSSVMPLIRVLWSLINPSSVIPH